MPELSTVVKANYDQLTIELARLRPDSKAASILSVDVAMMHHLSRASRYYLYARK